MHGLRVEAQRLAQVWAAQGKAVRSTSNPSLAHATAQHAHVPDGPARPQKTVKIEAAPKARPPMPASRAVKQAHPRPAGVHAKGMVWDSCRGGHPADQRLPPRQRPCGGVRRCRRIYSWSRIRPKPRAGGPGVRPEPGRVCAHAGAYGGTTPAATAALAAEGAHSAHCHHRAARSLWPRAYRCDALGMSERESKLIIAPRSSGGCQVAARWPDV